MASDKPMAFFFFFFFFFSLNPSKFQFYPSILNLFTSTKKKKTNVEAPHQAPRPNSALRISDRSANSRVRCSGGEVARGLTRRSRSDLVALAFPPDSTLGDVVVHVEAKAVDSEAEEVETKSSHYRFH
ncbi:hypothetical protein FCV25MIE_17232 [Fagus crenata]